MYHNQYVKIALVVPKVHLGKPCENAKEIAELVKKVEDASIVLFPELAITGYSLGDWFFNQEVLTQNSEALEMLLQYNKEKRDQVWIIGGPLAYQRNLYNVAYVMQNGKFLGIVPKMNMPTYREFSERRFFRDGIEFINHPIKIELLHQQVLFGEMIFQDLETQVSFGIEICEDLWQNHSPHIGLYENGVHMIFNLSSSPFHVGKHDRRLMLCQSASYLGSGAYMYVSTGISETSSDIVMSGHVIATELGDTLLNYEKIQQEEQIHLVDIDIQAIEHKRHLLNVQPIQKTPGIVIVPYLLRSNEDQRISLNRFISPRPFALEKEKNKNDVIDVITAALHHRLSHIGIQKVVLGVSGGLDSTLALLMIHECFERYSYDKKNILAYSMPGLATGDTSKQHGKRLAEGLGIVLQEIDIKEEVLHHFQLIGKNEMNKDITYENIQARYRTMILMNIANKEGALVCGTSDMSEIALGWSTFNGDQMSMYNLNGGLPKTVIQEMVQYFSEKIPAVKEVLDSILDTPISPELTDSTQKTEDVLGKYEINDFILYHLFSRGASQTRILYLLNQIFKLPEAMAKQYYSRFMSRFCRNQFKRLTGPESVKIFEFSLSARGDLHFPGDMKF